MATFGRNAQNSLRHVIQDEGVSLAARARLNFVGDGIVVADDSGTDASIVSVPGATIGSTILDPRLGVPQGTLVRTYTFDANAQGWAASAGGGAVTYDSPAKAITFTTSSTAGNYIALDPGGNILHGEVVVDLAMTHATLVDCGIVFRYTDDNNYYMLALRSFGFTGGTTAQMYKRIAGVFTVISDNDALSAHEVQFGSGARLRVMVRFVGPQIEWYLNEAFGGKVSDSSITGAGKLAVRAGPSHVVTIYQAQGFTHASNWEPFLYGSGGAGSSATGMSSVQDEGLAVPARTVLNFVGTGVTATDDSVGGKTIVTIPGAGPAATGAILGVGITTITVSSGAPSSPTTGDIWIKRS